MENNNEVLLKVDHLCQYFRLRKNNDRTLDNQAVRYYLR